MVVSSHHHGLGKNPGALKSQVG